MNRSSALMPAASGIAVPPRWHSLRVSRQGEDDHASGLHCIATAARHLAHSPAEPSRILQALAPPHASRIQARLSAVGLLEKEIRILAATVGLGVYRPNTHKVAQFKCQEPGLLWMAFVLVKFTALSGTERDQGHYVLVLDHVAEDGALVLADPHPWNPPVYCVERDDFESAWRAAKTKGPPWAAWLGHPTLRR
jgi:hypothetical protein